MPGFGLRVQPTGHKAWIVKFRERGRQRFVTLGPTTTLPIDAARLQARAMLEQAALDGLPARRATKAAPLFRDYAAEFWQDYSRRWKPSTQKGNARVLRVSPGDARSRGRQRACRAKPMRPDRIILGELRGAEASTFLRAINTGHPGSMTTIHADTPDGALEQLALLVLRSGGGLRREDVLGYLRSVIEVTVQLERYGGKRSVPSVVWKTRRELR